MTIKRILNKIYRESYIWFHPCLWNKKLQINGIPKIGNISKLKLGQYVSLNENVYIQSVGGVTINNYVTISHGATILTSGLQSDNYPNIYKTPNRVHVTKPVYIDEGVWLGAGCMVMPGVTIARGIIVAAGAVVSKDLTKEGWLYGGIPARPIKALAKE